MSDKTRTELECELLQAKNSLLVNRGNACACCFNKEYNSRNEDQRRDYEGLERYFDNQVILDLARVQSIEAALVFASPDYA